MAGAKIPGDDDPPASEIEPERTLAGRLARRMQRARVLGKRIEAARADHVSIDVGFDVVERDSVIAGGLLAGALAYRMFVLLLPSALLLIAGLGLYAGTVDKSTSQVVADAGLHGLIASEVASAASGRGRGIVFLLALPVVVYATIALYRSIAKVYGIVWHSSGREARITRRGVAYFAGALVLQLVAVETVGWIRRHDEFGGAAALLVYLVLAGGSWLVVSTQLPHRDVRWPGLIPGALLFGAGLLCVNVFNVYVTTRLLEGREDTYGALGVAAAVLFSLVLVGRLFVLSGELNASLHERRSRNETLDPQ